MKQGSGNSRTGSTKTEPVSHAIDPGAASQIGIQVVNTRPKPLVTGRGYSAPTAVCTTHKSGSQGKF